ncbi:hypothetical protein D3C86_851900 [compost metagenome]
MTAVVVLPLPPPYPPISPLVLVIVCGPMPPLPPSPMTTIPPDAFVRLVGATVDVLATETWPLLTTLIAPNWPPVPPLSLPSSDVMPLPPWLRIYRPRTLPRADPLTFTDTLPVLVMRVGFE